MINLIFKEQLVAIFCFLAILGCNSKKSYLKVEETTAKFVSLQDFNTIYVFDEFSCSICTDNILVGIKAEEADDFIVLYSEQNFEDYTYENSILVGYVPKSKILPASPEVIRALRIVTNTLKGNYRLQIEDKHIKSIKNY